MTAKRVEKSLKKDGIHVKVRCIYGSVGCKGQGEA